MRERPRPLLCELHAHTTWSDGELSLRELVDLYGTASFDVLCVTDHVLRDDDPWPVEHRRTCVDASNIDAYLAAIEREAVRALSTYGLLLVPGLELTYNDPDPDAAGHAVAVGLRGLVGMNDGPAVAMDARAFGRRGGHRSAPARHEDAAAEFAPDLLLRAELARAPRALRPRRALQRQPPLQLGRGGGTACRRGRRPPPRGAAPGLDDPRPVRAGRGGARRLSPLAPAGLPGAVGHTPVALAA